MTPYEMIGPFWSGFMIGAMALLAVISALYAAYQAGREDR
jgi:hypothetical protein